MHTKRAIGILAATALTIAAGSAQAYPPRESDWVALSTNVGAAIAAWDKADFIGAINSAPAGDSGAARAILRQRMAGFDAACGAIREQIGSGGLFGPDLWTQGFRQTCWAMATLEKDFTPSNQAKVCGEAKDAINFFKQYKPARSPAAYPLAAEHVARFVAINETLKQAVQRCR
ncbi:MAG: hypothetical protein HY859_15240 [Caulobacterales bacterium]|nr:hypothetical protein [Caulobacterales bacterium]